MPSRSPAPARMSPSWRRWARRVDGGWSISGEKWFVTDADIANYLIVVAEAEGHGQTCFPRRQRHRRRGARRGDPRYMHTFRVSSTGVRVRGLLRPRRPGARARPGAGPNELSKDWFHRTSASMIAAPLPTAAPRRARLESRPRVRAGERVQFGRADHRQPGRLVPRWPTAPSEIAATRALTYQGGLGVRPPDSIAKTIHAKAVRRSSWYASEMAGRVVDRCVQVLGGRGYMREKPLRSGSTAICGSTASGRAPARSSAW